MQNSVTTQSGGWNGEWGSGGEVQEEGNIYIFMADLDVVKLLASRDQMANIRQIIEKAKEFQKNIYFCFIDYAKALDCVVHSKLWKILKEMGIPDHLICFLRNLYSGQEETEPDMEQWTGSKSGKEYVKAVYCHPACLTYMQSTS